MICVAVLFVSMAFPAPALFDPAGGSLPEATLVFSTAYVWLSPVVRVLDQLSLLGVSQHLIVILTILGLSTGLAGRAARGTASRLKRGAFGLVRGLAFGLAIYATLAYVPRPVPRLVLEDPDLVSVDFHTHSLYSHDVADRHSVQWAHALHARAGFDAFVLSDHSEWSGVEEGRALNPARAGDGTSVLSGIEVWLDGEHIIGLGERDRYEMLFDSDRSDFLRENSDRLQERPTFIVTIPGDPFRIPALDDSHPLGVVAIEVHDGAPRGLEQGQLQGDSIVAWARSNDLAVVSAWNNHGPGQTPTAWTILRISGWQALSPEALLAAVEDELHDKGFGATQVLARPAPSSRSSLGVVLTAPSGLWLILRSLTTPERMVWLLYLLGAWAVSSLSVRRQVT